MSHDDDHHQDVHRGHQTQSHINSYLLCLVIFLQVVLFLG